MTAVLRNRFHSASGYDSSEMRPLIRRSIPPAKHDEQLDGQYESFDRYQQRAAEHGIEGVLASLASRAHEKFDTTRSEHLQTLANLSLLAFPGVPFEVRSPRWRELGFQSEDPATDLRGAGYLGLLHFTHLLAETGPSFRRSNVSDTFPLALASLSCTAMLCRYFGLSKTLIFPGSDAPQARDDVVRSFLLLQAKGAGGHDVLQVLHSRLLRHVARIWSSCWPPCLTLRWPSCTSTKHCG